MNHLISVIICPQCGYEAKFGNPMEAKLLLGKPTKCPKCAHTFTISADKTRGPAQPQPPEPAPSSDPTVIVASISAYLAIYPQSGQAYPLALRMGDQMLGRARPGNVPDIALPDNAVSGKHAQISLLGTAKPMLLLRDANSTNGTWLMGRRLGPGEQFYVLDQQYFQVGLTHCLFFHFQGAEAELKNHLARLPRPPRT